MLIGCHHSRRACERAFGNEMQCCGRFAAGAAAAPAERHPPALVGLVAEAVLVVTAGQTGS